MKKDNIYKLIAVSGFALLAISIYLYYKTSLDKKGIYTLAKCVNWEADSEGSTSVFDIYFSGKTYHVKTTGNYEYAIGKMYIVKILPSNPNQIGKLIGEASDCIIEKPLPEGGWKNLPDCK